jgi:hypothetical protein
MIIDLNSAACGRKKGKCFNTMKVCLQMQVLKDSAEELSSPGRLRLPPSAPVAKIIRR